ncbi:CocE/NonD family hydrolase [Phenylobacterium sp.]|uniref:CocE/NonD family hydrolase n=1 Tax=Phenylobacterium sp. TaxID=1871053 RepID=UPI0035B15974
MFRPLLLRAACASALLAFAALPGAAQTPPMTPDLVENFKAPTDSYDYVKREEMIPMRDGVKLYTVIVIPKGAKNAPILLTRTPYNAAKRAARYESPHMLAELPQMDEPFVEDGYIRVFQDVRGKYRSEGQYIMTRPARGPLNSSEIDHATDAYDTIDWLVKNVPETNGKVGMIGSSYEGFTVAMALTDPHPALKVAAPQSPMIDGWMGDDWFHYGAFRQVNLDYFTDQLTAKGAGDDIPRGAYDDYETFRRAGSAGAYAKAAGLEQIPWWRKTIEHPAYDAFWQEQALDKILAGKPLKVPTMWIGALWDQEDMWGAAHAYAATETKDVNNDKNFLVIGPWRHSGVNYSGYELGELKFEGDTALQFRTEVLKPFFDQYLKDGAPKADTPPVFIFESGTNRWTRQKAWPLACQSGCQTAMTPLYLKSGFSLGLGGDAGSAGADDYVSDPAKPVPYQPRPVSFADGEAWRTWLVRDQRFAADRTDVLTYVTDELTAPVKIAGAPVVDLYASTTGTDGDFVVKLIDVYPDEAPSDPKMGGFELGVAMDIFRGRYRKSFSKPEAITAGKVERYHFALPNADHVFLPGHRIMVQIQSSWFPLYDRNPQTFVPNIFFAKPGDYQKATIKVFHGGASASAIELPVVTD